MTIEEFDEGKHSVDEITELLHLAYAKLLDMGLHFWATTQPAEMTLKRLKAGRGLVALSEGSVVGTVTYYSTAPENDCAWYTKAEVSRFGQFAVSPRHQGQGLGTRLLSAVEAWARADGKRELALDTSEKARHLIEYYQKKGFRAIQPMQWNDVNYRSVVLSKTLDPAASKESV